MLAFLHIIQTMRRKLKISCFGSCFGTMVPLKTLMIISVIETCVVQIIWDVASEDHCNVYPFTSLIRNDGIF